MTMYKEKGEQTCGVCKGRGREVIWSGSIHDPSDPRIIPCRHCKGTGRVEVVDNH